jgi:hypothetical protein
MRTTLTLDEDVAVQLRRLVTRRRQPFRQIVNEALRAGLAVLTARRTERPEPYRIVPVSLGSPRLPNLDDVAEVLAVAEGESHP